VSTIIGTGSAGYAESQVNNPYGLLVGRDGALYFCDLDNQRIRRLDLKTRRTTDVAGNGHRAYAGDGGPATTGSLNMPHEIAFDARGHMYIAERDNHVVRRVDGATGAMSTLAGTGIAGFAGDGGAASRAQLRQPHSIVVTREGQLLICDVGNHRIRAVDLPTGIIETAGGTGERLSTPDGAPLKGTPLNGPRTMVTDRDGTIYLALREGNAIYRIAPTTRTLHHLAGAGEQGYSGDDGPARLARLAGPKGLALAGRNLYLADTENHAIRRIDLDRGTITTVLGTGVRGDGPETDPLQCKLARPHGVFAGLDGTLYVADSEAHRIRLLKP
jgi:sugar lactone lactonase YvrE